MRASASIQHHLQPLVFLSHIYNSQAIKQINLITAKLGSFGSIKARLWVINENVAFVEQEIRIKLYSKSPFFIANQNKSQIVIKIRGNYCVVN